VVLAPPHVGQTISAAPALFWYVGSLPDADERISFTVMADAEVKPLLEVTLDSLERPGIQRVRISDCGAQLQLGVEYEWSIALVVDPDQRSKDLIASGFIQRVPEPADLKSRGSTPQSYAELGLWYDALASFFDAIEQRPDDRQLIEARNALLRQANLEDAIEP
jgi:hypothetical protein